MRMRQSLAHFEQAFEQEAVLEQHRRLQLRHGAVRRTRIRRRAKIEQGQKTRFMLLLVAIVLTIVAVTSAVSPRPSAGDRA